MYAGLPEVRYAERNADVGIASDVCMEPLGDAQDTNLYIFATGFNDCPSGCIDAQYQGYARDASGAVSSLGSFQRGEAAPGWYRNAQRCRAFLAL